MRRAERHNTEDMIDVTDGENLASPTTPRTQKSIVEGESRFGRCERGVPA